MEYPPFVQNPTVINNALAQQFIPRFSVSDQIIIAKNVNESVTSSITLQDDDELFVNIGPNEEWIVEFSLDFINSLSSTGVHTAITIPSGALMNASGIGISSGQNGGHSGGSQTISGNTIVLFNAVDLTGSQATIKLNVWVLNGSTSGAITLQWAQGTLNGTALTLRRGSYLMATKIQR